MAQQSNMLAIKQGLQSEGSLAMFRDNLPNATGTHAIEAARRYAKMIYTVVCQNPSLQNCSLPSIVKAASISASLDLDIDPRGLAYLVPYKNKGNMEAQFQIGYLGLIELAYRSGKVRSISAHCIYDSEKDTVKIDRTDGKFTVIHPFSYKAPTGDMIAVYASAEIEGCDPMTCVLRKDEVEALRKKSKAPNSPAWSQFYPAMAKKTAIRQLAKFLPKSILEDFAKGAAIDERETFVESQTNAQETIENKQGSEAVDAAFEEPAGTQDAPANSQTVTDKEGEDFLKD